MLTFVTLTSYKISSIHSMIVNYTIVFLPYDTPTTLFQRGKTFSHIPKFHQSPIGSNLFAINYDTINDSHLDYVTYDSKITLRESTFL